MWHWLFPGNSGFIVCCSVANLCLTLCSPEDCSIPGSPVLHYLLEFAQTHVHWVSHAIHPTISSSIAPFSCPQSFPALESFPMSQLFASGGLSISWMLSSSFASVLPINIQGWFPLGLTALISLLSKGLSRHFSSTAFFFQLVICEFHIFKIYLIGG